MGWVTKSKFLSVTSTFLSAGGKGRGRLQAGILCAMILVLAFAATAYAVDWRFFPDRRLAPDTIGKCTFSASPLFDLHADPELQPGSWIFFLGCTMRPHRKVDFHIIAENGIYHRTVVRVEDENGNVDIRKIARGLHLSDVIPAIYPYCYGRR